MTDHIEQYLRQVDQHLTLEGVQRQQVLSELRSHLWETVNESQKADPARAPGDIERQVVADFGAPEDLAIAYNPEGSVVLTDASGSTVLTFSAAATRAGKAAGQVATKSAKAVGKGATALGRGVGGFLKVFLIVFAVVVGVALLSASLVGVFLFDDIKAVIEENAQSTVYQGTFDGCARSFCNESMAPKAFYVNDDVKRLRFMLAGHGNGNETVGGGGLLLVSVRDPDGTTVLDVEYDLSPREGFWERGAWAAKPGYWQFHVQYVDFKGHFELHVESTGLID